MRISDWSADVCSADQICTPRRPKCILCPWAADCIARRAGIEETLPAKLPKADKPTRRGLAFWLVNGRGAVLLRRRPEKGLLGGMMEVTSTEIGRASARERVSQ